MSKRPSFSDEDPQQSGEDYEECPVCHQEFTGVCPINSGECPYAEETEEEEEEDEESDFEDVEKLGEVLEDDEEADKLAEEGEDEAFDEEDDEP